MVPDHNHLSAGFNQTRQNKRMLFHWLIAFSLLLLPGSVDESAKPQAQEPIFEWSTVASTTPPNVGGSFGGVIKNKIILAGGSFFPAPEGESKKVWLDRIITFDLDRPTDHWVEEPINLPTACGYGSSISLPDHSILWIGGSDGSKHLSTCHFIELTPNGLRRFNGPELPIPLSYMSSALVGNLVYVVGGSTSPNATAASDRVFALDWSNRESEWIELPPIPGGGERILSATASHGGSLYVFGGCRLVESEQDQPERLSLTDSWRFSTRPDGSGSWTRLSDMPRSSVAAPVPCPTVGSSFIVVAGGDDGSHVGSIAKSSASQTGVYERFLAYHVITDEWSLRPGFPGSAVVSTPTLFWNGRFIFPGGEVNPRIGSGAVLVATPVLNAPRFSTLDWFALSTYLFLLVLLGVYFARRDQTTEDFFLGGHRIPWWAAGISIFATQLSAITFMAIPAKSYSSDWTLFIQSLGIFVMAPVVAYLFLPFFRRLNLTTAYEYLERRFSLIVRLFGSAQYLLFQFGRMAIVVYLPAIALSAVTGFEVHTCILLMGVLCIIYTVLGGIEAVIWSDVIQAFVLLGGALLILYGCITGVEGGVLELYERASDSGRLQMANTDWDFTKNSLPVVILGGIFINLIPYASDQSVVQRYLTTSDERSARKAIWLGGIISIPASILFFSLGTALFGFYDANPERLAPISKTDQIVPWFLVNEVPAGLAGLVIAGIFAAAMSSLDSSMNSSATVLINDFYRRLRTSDQPRDESRDLLLARIITVILGSLGTLAALLLAYFPAESIFDQWLEIVGLFASGLCGLFVLGIFTQRSGTTSAIVGVLSSILVLLLVKETTNLSGLLYAAIGTLTCVLAGWLSSLLLPSQGSPPPGTSFCNRSRIS